MKLIIHQINGAFFLTLPTGEISIEEVLQKDVPDGAVTVDSDDLPYGGDVQFLEAWEMVDGKVVINLEKHKVTMLRNFNSECFQAVQARQLVMLSGDENAISDEEFINANKKVRLDIREAKTLAELLKP